jgi:hypothetical protein
MCKEMIIRSNFRRLNVTFFRSSKEWSGDQKLFRRSKVKKWIKIKQWQLAPEFCECKFCKCREYLQMHLRCVLCWSCDLPNLPTFAKQCCADSPDSLTFPKPCCADSPDSPTFAKPCCADSPDSQKASLASDLQIWWVWRVWGIWQVLARPFYAYKIYYLCLKRPILLCVLAPTFTKRLGEYSPYSPSHVAWTCQTRRHLPSRVARTRQTRQHLPKRVAWNCQIRRHSPKAIFKKNVTHLAKFAPVTGESRKFGASSHCLNKINFWCPYRTWD